MSDMVFVVNSGRCGSRYLANLLTANGYDAEHEPLHHRGNAIIEIPDDPVERVRMRPICEVEVNCQLNTVLHHLVDEFPDAKYVHLHRNGPESVRSQLVMSNGDLTKHGGSTQFEGACCWWRNSNVNHLANMHKVDNSWSLPFKDLIDGDKAHEFWSELGYPLTETKEVPPENSTPDSIKEQFPPPEEWGPHFRSVFRDICGEVMKELGYEDDWKGFV